MSLLKENRTKMYKRKIVSKYNFIQQEIENTHSILDKAKAEIDEKVGMFLKGDDDDLATCFAEIDQDLEAFHSRLCLIQETLEDSRLSIENNIVCNSDGKNQEKPQDTESGASRSSRSGGDLELVESASSSSSQNDQISYVKNDFPGQLASQLHSESEKKINTELGTCAAEPNVAVPLCNEPSLPNITLSSNISNLQNNIKIDAINNTKQTNSERSKFSQNVKSNSVVEHLSSSDGSSVYRTVSSGCSDVLTAEKTETVPSKYFVKQLRDCPSSFNENRADCHLVAAPTTSKPNCAEDTLRTHPVDLSPNMNTIPYPDLKIGSHIIAAVQDINSPSDFWVQIDNGYTKELCPVTNAECYDWLPVAKKDGYCLAPFKQSGEYYRAKILEVNEKVPGKQRVKVLYVDLGCKASLCASTLKVLPAPLLRIPSVAVHCALRGVIPVDAKWSYNAVEQFRTTIEVSDIKIRVCSRVNDTYFVQVSMTADLPDGAFTYDMVAMLCEYKFAVRENNAADVHQRAVLSPETSAPISSRSSSSNCATCPSNDLSSMNSGENLRPAKDETSSDSKTLDRNILNCNFQQEVHHNKELDRVPIIVNKEGDIKSVTGSSVAQGSQANVKNISSHHKGAERNRYGDALSEPNSYVNKRLQPHENKSLVSSSDVSGTDSCTANHKVKVPMHNPPCVTNDSCNTRKVSQSYCDDFDWNLSIPFPTKKFEKKAKFIVMLSAIISPSDFYVNLAMPNSTDLDDLQEHMLSVYQNFKKSNRAFPSVDNLCGMFACCQFAEDKNWYRVQVLEVCNLMEDERNEDSITWVRVQYVDYGNESVVNMKDLKPLKKDFANFPAFSFHCSLAGIKPKLPENPCDNTEDNKWSAEAISRFKCLTNFEKCYTAEIADTVIYDKRKTSLPVYLWDTVSTKDILINSILVEQGAASGSDLELLNLPAEDNLPDVDNIEKWDPMAEDYHSTLNSYGVNMNDPEIATVGYKARDERYVCKFFSRSGYCARGDRCYYQHIFTYGDSTIDKEPVEYLGESLPLPAVDSAVFVLVSAMFNPGHFFVVFPFGIKSVESIQSEIRRCVHKEEDVITEFTENMNKYYNRNHHRKENTALAPACGDLVAVKWNKDGRWYRGRVCDVFDISAPVLIYFLDFGNTEVIERANVRELDLQFRHFPFQAVECHLHGIGPKSSEESQKWSEESKIKFQEVTERKTLVAHIKSIFGSSLYVELFICSKDQELSINEYLVHSGYGQLVQQTSCNNSSLSHNSQKDRQNKNVIFIPA